MCVSVSGALPKAFKLYAFLVRNDVYCFRGRIMRFYFSQATKVKMTIGNLLERDMSFFSREWFLWN